MRFDRRAGPVVSLVTYDGRPVLYQGSLAEIFVPYQDPDPNWFYRTYMDAGEFGFGLLASPLTARPRRAGERGAARRAWSSAAHPRPERAGGAAAAVARGGRLRAPDRQPGVAPLRAVLAAAPTKGRAEVELVVRSIAQVGNYDYLLDWVFTQRRRIRVEVGLTGIDAPKGVRAGSVGEHGDRHSTPVAPQLVAPFHSHHFNFRLDLDVDGPSNSFMLGQLEAAPGRPGRARACGALDEARGRRARARAGSTRRARALEGRQRRAAATRSASPPATWSRRHDTPSRCSHKADYQRAGFIEHALWITAFDADERYAAGDTPNQNPGSPGLPQYAAQPRALVNRDIVLWLTLGHHHVTQAEDWPVMSRQKLAFELKPVELLRPQPGARPAPRAVRGGDAGPLRRRCAQASRQNSGPSSWRTSHSISQSSPWTFRKRRVSSMASCFDFASRIA